MRLRIPVIVKDPEVSDWKEIAPTETITVESEEMFLDGPVSRRSSTTRSGSTADTIARTP